MMAAIYNNSGKIRPQVSLVKSLTSAISIGSGGSVGREGPIVQIGASFGSTLGQLLNLKPRDTITLVAAGVAGGIAATFNAPIGGVIFAIELILPEFSILTFLPLVVSATFATFVASLFLGVEPAFIIPAYQFVSSYEFFFYILLGFLSAFVAILYIKVLYGTEDFFDNLNINSYVKATAGALLLGVIGYVLMLLFGHYYVFGVGYGFITDTLQNNSASLFLIVLLVFLKIVANSLTLAAGGSGGIFAPSLFMGIGTGAAVGIVVNTLFPAITAPVSAYALVGMAAVVAGTTGASLTAIVMTFEMTRDYEIMLPLMLAVVIAHFTTRYIYKETIYSKKLSRRGLNIQSDKLVNIFKITSIKEVLSSHIIYATKEMAATEALVLMTVNDFTLLPIIDGESVVGIVKLSDLNSLYEDEGEILISELYTPCKLEVDMSGNTFDALIAMEESGYSFTLVRDGGKIVGVTTRTKILNTYFEKRRRLLE